MTTQLTRKINAKIREYLNDLGYSTWATYSDPRKYGKRIKFQIEKPVPIKTRNQIVRDLKQSFPIMTFPAAFKGSIEWIPGSYAGHNLVYHVHNK